MITAVYFHRPVSKLYRTNNTGNNLILICLSNGNTLKQGCSSSPNPHCGAGEWDEMPVVLRANGAAPVQPQIKQPRDSLWLKQISALISDSHLSLRARWNALGTASAFQLWRARAHWTVHLGKNLCCLQPEQQSYLISTTKNPLPMELRGTWAVLCDAWWADGKQGRWLGWQGKICTAWKVGACFPQPFALPLKRQFRFQTEQFDPLVYGETGV